eukprot:5250660-Amphidinium_carterae.1
MMRYWSVLLGTFRSWPHQKGSVGIEAGLHVTRLAEAPKRFASGPIVDLGRNAATLPTAFVEISCERLIYGEGTTVLHTCAGVRFLEWCPCSMPFDGVRLPKTGRHCHRSWPRLTGP